MIHYDNAYIVQYALKASLPARMFLQIPQISKDSPYFSGKGGVLAEVLPLDGNILRVVGDVHILLSSIELRP